MCCSLSILHAFPGGDEALRDGIARVERLLTRDSDNSATPLVDKAVEDKEIRDLSMAASSNQV